jgi:hypothetical protein
MALNDEIDRMRKEIRTDGYGMSIGEWMSLYEDGEIDIHPEFQRFYRWTEIQKSNLIESILLGIPIPPIFVSQRKEGIWDVVDGLQRLSTIYQLVGILQDEDGQVLPALELVKTKYLPSLAGKKWDDVNDPDHSFSMEQRLLVRRAKINVSIVLRESDEIAKYELFQRLNTGGTSLEPQEVRNCIMVMINPSFHKWIKDLSSYGAYQECIALSDKNLAEQYDLELALRFIVFSTLDMEQFDRSKDVGEYLTESMVTIAQDQEFDRESVEQRFRNTFDHLSKSCGSDSFRRYADGRFTGGFLLSPFEVISFGLGFNHPNFPSTDQTKEKIKQIYQNETYQRRSGSGIRANQRLPHLIPLGREIFRP